MFLKAEPVRVQRGIHSTPAFDLKISFILEARFFNDFT